VNLILPIVLVGVALMIVLAPLLRRAPTRLFESEAELDAEVARVRAALSTNTVCARCAEANPPESRFCMRCGRRLAGER
jgi:hypothetical protein